MLPVSDAFLRTVRSSHEMAVRVRVVKPGQIGVNPEGDEIDVIDGDVQLDATADIRGTVDLTTDGHGWDPRPGRHPIEPYGTEVFVQRGVEVGAPSYASLGYYRLYSVEQQEAPNGPLQVLGKDRMSGIVDAKLTSPVQFKAKQSVQDVFNALVLDVYPWATIEYDWAAGSDLLGRQVIADGEDSEQGNDRYGFLADLVKSRGKIWYWDYRGVLVVKDPPDATVPVFDVDAGPDGVLVTPSRSIDRDGVFNAVLATGEAGDGDNKPVRSLAFDANPDSPTFWDGPFGKVPQFYSSSMLTKFTQSAAAARSILQRSTGLPYSVDFSMVPNPALEPYDPVRVTYEVGGNREVHVLQKVTIPLVEGQALTASTREQGTVRVATTDEGDA